MVYGIPTIVFRGWASWSRVAPEIHLAHQEEVPRETRETLETLTVHPKDRQVTGVSFKVWAATGSF